MSTPMMNERLSRRSALLSGAAAFASGAVLINTTTRAQDVSSATKPREESAAGEPARDESSGVPLLAGGVGRADRMYRIVDDRCLARLVAAEPPCWVM